MSSEHHPLADRTLLVSGGSRGIGLAIAIGAARLGDDPMWDIFVDKP